MPPALQDPKEQPVPMALTARTVPLGLLGLRVQPDRKVLKVMLVQLDLRVLPVLWDQQDPLVQPV